jgi:uncharacterized protein with PQ loop repeat
MRASSAWSAGFVPMFALVDGEETADLPGIVSIQLENWLVWAGIAQSCVPIFSLCAYIPQWRKLLKLRDSGAISLGSWILWAFSYTTAVVYSALLVVVTGRGWPILLTAGVGLVSVLFTISLIWRFRAR